MKKKGLLLVVLLLAIGFAAVTTTLFINGNVTIAEKTSDFKVYFSSAIQDGLDKTNILISDDKQSIDYTIDNLSKLNQTSVLEYQVTNDSNQYDANVSVSCTLSDNEYVKMTNSLSNEIIEAKSQKDGVLTVELVKVSTEEKTVTLHCELVADAIERTEVNNGTIETDTYTLSGYLQDESGNPLANRNLVVYSETPHYVLTDNYGYFAVTGLEKGEHEIYYLNSPMNEIKGMTKEEVKNNKIAETQIHTNRIDEMILFDNNYKMVSVLSNTNVPITYTIELDSAEGILENKTYEVTENKVFGDLPTPTKEGHKFLGWYLDDKLITNTTYVVGTELTKLVAKYEIEEYNVTINNTNATASSSSISIKYGSSGKVTITPSSGYYLSSMTCTNGYTTNAVVGKNSTDSQTITISNNNKTSGSTCTVSTTPISYTVTIETDNTGYGTVSSESVSIPYGTTYSVSGNTLTFSNGITVTATAATKTEQYVYNFSSWSSTSGTITGATTITANFSRSTRNYRITVKLGNKIRSTLVPYGAEYSFEKCGSIAQKVSCNGKVSYYTGQVYNLNFSPSGSSIQIRPDDPSDGIRYSIDENSLTSGTITSDIEIIVTQSSKYVC